MERIGESLAHICAAKANATDKNDKLKICQRIVNSAERRFVGDSNARSETIQFLCDDERSNHFSEFDIFVSSLLASPLLQIGLGADNGAAALKYVGLGAVSGKEDLEKIEHLLGRDLTTARVASRFGTECNRLLSHVAAFFGKTEHFIFLVGSWRFGKRTRW